MTQDVPHAALAVCLWGQDLAVDAAAIARLRAGQPGLRLVAICIAGAEPPPGLALDRVIHLPLGREHLATAEAIGLQLCFNEGCRAAGTLRRLDASEIAAATRHFALLALGQADAVVLPEGDPEGDRLFLSERAAFLASCWAALAAIAGERQRVASALLGLTGRRGVVLRDGVHAPLERCDAAELAPLAGVLRQKLGLFIGGIQPPRVKPIGRVAVVTPYYKEPDDELRRVMASVAGQSHACHHIMVSDGFPNDLARQPGVTHIELDAAHGDNGNTPRYVGALVALARGYDAVAFLDADNWFEPKHIERLVARQHESGAGAVFSLRNVFLPDGTKVPVEKGEDVTRAHVDTSCMLITRDCEYALHLWGQMPQEWGPACDRVVFSELGGQRLAWTSNRTLNFKSHYADHYHFAGKPVPADTHAVPRGLIVAFRDMPPAFRERAISRTGRVITPRRRAPSA